jgi:hypothetical protein
MLQSSSSGSQSGVCVSQLSITDGKYLSSWFQRFQFMVCWSSWFGSVATQFTIMRVCGKWSCVPHVSGNQRETRRGRESQDPLQVHPAIGLTYSRKAPPAKGSTTSPECQRLTTKSLTHGPLRDISDPNCKMVHGLIWPKSLLEMQTLGTSQPSF